MPKKYETGKECPNCLAQQLFVREARTVGTYKRRRRVCRKCGHRETTYEISAEDFELIRHIYRQRDEKRKRRLEKLAAQRKANVKVCHDCKHWGASFTCDFEFPDAGGTFAEECSLYERPK